MSRDSVGLSSGAFLVGGITVGVLCAVMLNKMLWAYLAIGLDGALSEYMAAIGLAVFVAACIPFLPVGRRVRRTLIWLWVLRCLVTLIFMVAYEKHYRVLDAFTYYRSAVNPPSGLQLEWMQGTDNLIFCLSVLVDWLPLLKSYPAIKVLFSLFGLIGAFFFWLSYVAMTDEEDTRLLFLLGAFPSLIFWSSILGKDPVVFMGLGMMAYACVNLFKSPTLNWLLLLTAGSTLVATIRMWMVVTVLLAFAVTYVFSSSKFAARSSLTKLALLAVVFFLSGTMIEKLSLNSRDDVYDKINTVSRGWSAGGSQQEVPELKSFREIVMFLPYGIFSSLFRPLPGEVNNVFGMLAGVENIFLLIIVFQLMRNISKGDLLEKGVRFMALTVIIWALFYSLISFQNLGTATRFKIQVLPFILLLSYFVRLKQVRLNDAGRILGRRTFPSIAG